MNVQTLSLYIHIPFCKTMCSYCAFNTYTGLDGLIPAYITALTREIDYLAQQQPHLTLKTIFIGGGTPSLIPIADYDRLMTKLHDAFRILPSAEISLESNPDDLTDTYLRGLRQVGFNRLSIGMQSGNPQILKLFNRDHTTAQVVGAVRAAQRAHFDNISMDLIFGSPYQTLSSWRKTLDKVIALNIQNVSAYNLILEGNTPLKHAVDTQQLPTPDDDLAADMYELLSEKLEQAAFQQYEISNWAQSGYASQHNIQYWLNEPYLGLGAGAHGFANGVRYIVTRLPQKYIDACATTPQDLRFPRTPAVSKAIDVDRENDMQETILMNMRLTQRGVSRAAFRQRFGVDIAEIKSAAIQKHLDYGLIELTDDYLRLSPQGRLLSNAVIRDLI